MTTEDKLSISKIKLILAHPFFATLLLHMHLEEHAATGTMSTNGTRIRFNPAFVDVLSQPELTFVLAHEVMHVAALHHFRLKDRNAARFNRAADYAINQILVDAGLSMPAPPFNGLIDGKYANMSAEDIYDLLPEEPTDEGGAQPGIGDVEEPEQGPGQPSLAEQEQAVKELVVQAAQSAKMAGQLPGALQRFVEDIVEPVIDWKTALARFVVDIARNDYSFSRANKRFLHTGFCLPTLYSEELGEIYLFIDTSGSIDEEALNAAATELLGITQQFQKGFNVLYIDTEVAGTEEIDSDFDGRLHAAGGGGTCFRPGYEYLADQDITPRAVIYFTDGYCNTYPVEPAYETLWLVYGGRRDFAPPFGEVIRMNHA